MVIMNAATMATINVELYSQSMLSWLPCVKAPVTAAIIKRMSMPIITSVKGNPNNFLLIAVFFRMSERYINPRTQVKTSDITERYL